MGEQDKTRHGKTRRNRAKQDEKGTKQDEHWSPISCQQKSTTRNSKALVQILSICTGGAQISLVERRQKQII
jgi:hypothetical protein